MNRYIMDRVLVLNSDYSPINVTSVYRGFTLVHKGKAEVLKSSEKPIIAGIQKFVRPLVIRLLNYVKWRVRKLKVTRQRLFKRDNHECAYCGTKRNLTIDHILPKSRGGQNTWTNLITCCSSCNLRKGSRTPEELGIEMRYHPYEPTIFSNAINSSVESIWNEFQKSFFYTPKTT